MRELLKNHPGVTLKIDETGDFLWVWVVTTPTKTPAKMVVPLTALEKKIFNEIEKENTITFLRIADALSISRHTVAEYVKKLKAKGVIKRRGGTRSGYWEITSHEGEGE